MDQLTTSKAPRAKELDELKNQSKDQSIGSQVYLVYVLLTVILFGFLIFMGWLALDQGWIPK